MGRQSKQANATTKSGCGGLGADVIRGQVRGHVPMVLGLRSPALREIALIHPRTLEPKPAGTWNASPTGDSKLNGNN
jgi:hypothetical protein